MADSAVDHVEAFIASLPGDLPVRDLVAHLARTLSIANWSDARWASRRIREITDYAPWLPGVVAGKTSQEDFLAALRRIEGAGVTPIPKSRGRTADLPTLATINRPSAGAAYLEVIRAIYLGGHLSPRLATSPIAATHLDELGTAIRSIDLRSNYSHPLRDQFRKALGRESPAQLAEALFADPTVDGNPEAIKSTWRNHPVAASWRRVWLPWLLRAEQVLSGEQTHIQPSPNDILEGPSDTDQHPPASQQQQNKSNNGQERPSRGGQGRQIRLPATNGGFGAEPDDESTATISIVQLPTRPAEQVPADAKHEIAYAHQQIRHQNTSLLTTHIDVLSLGEWQLTTEKLIAAALVDPRESFEICRDATVARLVGLTGFDPDRVSTISLTPSPEGISVDLAAC